MGIDISAGTLLHEWIYAHSISGPLLTLGVQQLDFDWSEFSAATGIAHAAIDANRVPSARELFCALGIVESFSLDISDYEGADFLADLNVPIPPPHLENRFGAIFNGGTIEHVFDIAASLKAITRMLRVGGVIFHIVPVNNWIDHGFYQISPTLLFDYYETARFDILESAAIVVADRADGAHEIFPVLPGGLSVKECVAYGNRAILHMFAARKTADSLDDATPLQSIYGRKAAGPPSTLRWFPPFSTRRGIRMGGEFTEWTIGPFTVEEGHAWVTSLAQDVPLGDCIDDPRRSQLVLFEDGHLLGPAHALHADIRRLGGGCYSHWQNMMLLSSSDGSDPNHNGRHYKVVVPRSASMAI